MGLSRANEEYPWSLKTKLQHDSPALLFGYGKKKLLNQKSTVAGANVTQEMARELGSEAAKAGKVLVIRSGVNTDELAMSMLKSNNCLRG